MIDGNVEEPLKLVLVKIDPEHTIGARRDDHVRQQLGADGHARLIFSILPRVAVVRHHARDPRRRGPSRRVDEEQELHDRVGRRIRRLHDEHVRPAHVLVEPHEDLPVGKARQRDLRELHAQATPDLLGERPVGRPRDELEAAAWNDELIHGGAF